MLESDSYISEPGEMNVPNQLLPVATASLQVMVRLHTFEASMTQLFVIRCSRYSFACPSGRQCHDVIEGHGHCLL